jgi:2-octaprenyl-6-methoxyphenol hydroxylase
VVDAVVVGAGLAGLAAAVAVGGAGLTALHVAPAGPPDRRTSALMGPSVEYLRDAGLIDDPAAIGHPLKRIRLIDATGRLIRAPETLFDAEEFGLPAFGWNFPNVGLGAAFAAASRSLPNLASRETTLVSLARGADGWILSLADGTEVVARLVVAADGKKSSIRSAAGFRAREHAFAQSALVADLELGRPLGETSVEFHYPQGPFTLVPAGGSRANLVWIDDEAVLTAAKAGGADSLRTAAIEKSQRLFGDIRPLTPAFIFPLSSLSVDRAGANGIVLVGESAHAFPPIGAQGLNLGLRDVADLAAALAGRDAASPGWAATVSADYARRREADLRRTGGMVDALFRSLLSDLLPTQAARATGLWALKLVRPLRERAFAICMGRRS